MLIWKFVSIKVRWNCQRPYLGPAKGGSAPQLMSTMMLKGQLKSGGPGWFPHLHHVKLEHLSRPNVEPRLNCDSTHFTVFNLCWYWEKSWFECHAKRGKMLRARVYEVSRLVIPYSPYGTKQKRGKFGSEWHVKRQNGVLARWEKVRWELSDATSASRESALGKGTPDRLIRSFSWSKEPKQVLKIHKISNFSEVFQKFSNKLSITSFLL